MMESLMETKLQQFKAAATSLWGQKDAERIWGQTMWKIALKPKELLGLADGWANYCVSSNPDKLNKTCDDIMMRVQADK